MRGVRIALFALVWFSCAWFGSRELNPNNATRLFAAISLVEQGDATIDEFAPLTIDKAAFGGHFYLDKAPGMTLMAVPAVALGDAVSGERADRLPPIAADPFARYLRLRQRIAVAMGPAVLTALAAVALFDLALGITGAAPAALFAALGYALGTPAWGWSTTLFGHAPVAALYVIAIWAIWRGSRGPRVAAGLASLAGLALGWAVVIEYQAVLAGSAIAFWALWRCRGRAGAVRAIGAAVAGGAIALAPLAAYNLVAFGTVWRVGYAGVVGWEGMNQGLFGLTTPDLRVLWEIVFGSRRGLVWVAPVLILAPAGLIWCAEDRRTRDLALMAAAASLVVLLVNAAYVYWDGGNSTGPRLAIPMVGMLAIGLAPFWTMIERPALQMLAAAWLVLSMLINVAIAASEIFAPPTQRWPIWEGVVAGRLARGELQTIASDWFGWSAHAGLTIWALVAVPLLGWLAWRAGRA